MIFTKYDSCYIYLFIFNKFIYLFYFWLRWVLVAERGLSFSCGARELLFVVLCGLLIAMASLVAELGL